MENPDDISVKIPVGAALESYEFSDCFPGWLRLVSDYEFRRQDQADLEGAHYRFSGVLLYPNSFSINIERLLELPDNSKIKQAIQFCVEMNTEHVNLISVATGNRYSCTDFDLRKDFQTLARVSIDRASKDN